MQETRFGTANAEVATNRIRRDTLDGRPHLVAPVVAVRSMVLKGEYLPDEEIVESAPAWNGRPLPINHPTDAEGNFVSANSPETLSQQSVGRFFSAEASDGGDALVGELWVDVEKSQRLGGEAAEPLQILASHADESFDGVDAAENDDTASVLEVSTAYFYTPEESAGTANGASYNRVQRNIRPDHLALLPNEKGECSAADGCGAPRVHVHHAAGVATGGSDSAITNHDSAMTDIDVAWLSDHSAFDAETLESMAEERLVALKETVEATHDTNGDGCTCSGANAQDEQSDAQSDSSDDATQNTSTDETDGSGPSDGEIVDVVQGLADRVESIEETLTAQQQAERDEYVSTITSNAESIDADDLSDVPTSTLEAMAAEYSQPTPSAAGADFGGRIGAASSPNQNDADAEAFTGLAARLAGNSTEDDE